MAFIVLFQLLLIYRLVLCIYDQVNNPPPPTHTHTHTQSIRYATIILQSWISDVWKHLHVNILSLPLYFKMMPGTVKPCLICIKRSLNIY